MFCYGSLLLVYLLVYGGSEALLGIVRVRVHTTMIKYNRND